MKRDLTALNEIRGKQEALMAAVPHPLRRDSMERMIVGKDLIEHLLLYLNSTGHKPWRPNPLPREEQMKHLLNISASFQELFALHIKYSQPSPESFDVPGSRIMVSTFGAVEEATEFYDSWVESRLDSVAHESPAQERAAKDDRRNMLEELTDELFFFLERMILVDFTWDEIITEYHRKWDVNMQRYADAKKGNYDWDNRAGKDKL